MSIESGNGAPQNWSAKEMWKMRGKNFLIEVYHSHQSVPDYLRFDDGGHRWNVYAYIFPAHQHFGKFDSDAMYQEASAVLHFHGGPTHLSKPFYEGKQTCVKVGSDYNHLHDERFTRVTCAAEAVHIFSDAQALFDQLERMDKQEAA